MKKKEIILTILMIAILCVSAFAQTLPGDLDNSFNFDGKITTNIGSGIELGDAVAVQPDGKVVVVGVYGDNKSNERSLLVVRYKASGSLDTTFSDNGVFVKQFGTIGENAKSVVIQPNGKIVVAGYSYTKPPGQALKLLPFVLRLNSDGSPDASFGGSGFVSSDLGERIVLKSVVVQPDNKIVVAGYTTTSSAPQNSFILIRYHQNGKLDSSFGNNGVVYTSLAQFTHYGYDLTLQPNGKILLAGSMGLKTDSSTRDFTVIRYLSDGNRDYSFGNRGFVTVDFNQLSDAANDIALDSNQRIVLTGRAATIGSYADIAVTRLNTNGSLDTSFGNNGKVTTSVGDGNSTGSGIAIQSDGRIIVGGTMEDHQNRNFVVLRYKSNGLLDNSFYSPNTTYYGQGGIAIADFAGSDDLGLGIALDSSQRVVIVGRINTAEIGVARFLTQ